MLSIIRIIYSFINALLENNDSIITPVEAKSQPWALDGDIMYATQVNVRWEFLNVNVGV